MNSIAHNRTVGKKPAAFGVKADVKPVKHLKRVERFPVTRKPRKG